MLKNLLSKILPKFSSRRERMTYWMIALGFAMYIYAVDHAVPMLEVVAMYGAIAAVVGWYLQKETEAPSKLDM